MIKKLVVALLSLTILSVSAQTTKIGLAWDPVCNTNITFYVVYYGTNVLTNPLKKVTVDYVDDCGVNQFAETNFFKGSYNLTNVITGNTNTTTTLTNLVKGAKYYFTLTAKNAAGLESELSNEIEYTVPFHSSNSVPSKVRGTKILEIK